MRYRSHVADEGNSKAHGVDRTHRGFTSGARALDQDTHGAHTTIHCLSSGSFCCLLSRKRRILTRTLEPGSPRAGPTNHITCRVGKGDNRIIEGAVHVSNTRGDISLFLFLDHSLRSSHLSVSTQLLFLLANNGSAWAFACPRVGVRALTTTGQTASVPQPSVATDIHEPLDVGHDFTAQVAFNLVLSFEFFTQDVDIITSEFITVLGPINTCVIKDLECCSPANAINICQCNIEPFVSRQIYTN